ncbi:hypothetical protein QV08_10610, partial [Gallibacterium salpingitidis]|uniref:YadA-like family protein n=1 Tax=Gallibacterium salpingitidis TaxID=505341 RepID=UPI0008051AD9
PNKLESSFNKQITEAIDNRITKIRGNSGGEQAISGATTLAINGDGKDITTTATSGTITISLNKATAVADNDTKVVTSDVVYDAIAGAKTKVTAGEGDSYITVTSTEPEGLTGNSYKVAVNFSGLKDKLDETFLKAADLVAGSNIQITDSTISLNPVLTNLTSAQFVGDTEGQHTTINKDSVNIATGSTAGSPAATLTASQLTFAGSGQSVILSNTGLDNGNNKIINVAKGTADTDAVNVEQYKALVTKLGGAMSSDNNGTLDESKFTFATAVKGSTSADAPLNALTAINRLIEAANNRAETAAAIGSATNTDGQLATAYAVQQYVTTGAKLKYKAGMETAKETTLDTGLTFNGDDNLKVSTGANGVVNYALNNKLTGITSISRGDDSITLTLYDDSLKLNDKKIRGVADGDIKNGSKQVVNGGQLYTVLSNLKTNILGSDFNIANDGTLSVNGTIAGITGATTISDAFATLKGNIGELQNGVAGPVRYTRLSASNVPDANSELALVGAGNSTSTPIKLKNLKSGLSNLIDSTAQGTAITKENADTAVGSLLTLNGANLGYAATLGDLQAVAQAGLNFTGNTANVSIHRALSQSLGIVGAGTITDTNFAGVANAAGNIRVTADADNNKLIIELAKKLQALEEATFTKTDAASSTKVDSSGVTITPTSGDAISLTNNGLNNGGKEITNVATPTEDSSAANKGYVDKAVSDASKTLVDTGIKVQTSGNIDQDKTAQTVKLGETVQINNGANTQVSAVTSKDGVHSLNINVTGLPTAYTDDAGNKLVKVGDSYYKASEVVQTDGTINTTGKTAVTPTKVTLVPQGDNVTAMQLDGVKSAVNLGSNTSPNHKQFKEALDSAADSDLTKNSAVNITDLKHVNDAAMAGINIKTSANGGVVDNEGIAATGDNINPDKNTLEFVAGANVTLKQEAGKITISTNNSDIVNNVIENSGIPVSYGYYDEATSSYKKAYKIGEDFYKDPAGGDANKLSATEKGKLVARLDYNDPMTLTNVKSALGLTGNYDNSETPTNGGTAANPQKITPEAAKAAIEALLDKAGVDLNQAVNLGDLQAVAQAGLDFTANNQKDGQDVVIHRPAGTKIAIKGEGTVAQNADKSYKTATNNIVVEADAEKSELTVKLAEDLRNLKSAIFETAEGTDSLQVDGNGVRFLKEDGTVDSNAPSIAKTGIDAGNQKVTNVKDGDIKNDSEDAVNGGQIAKILGMPTDENGKVKGIGGTTKDTIDGALKEVRSEVNNNGKDGKEDTNIGISKETGKNGQDVYSVNMSKNLVLETVTLTNGTDNAKLSVVRQDQYKGSETALNVNGIRVTGVADAKDPTDAVNLKQMQELGYQVNTRVSNLESKVNKMDKRLRAGIAGAIATANLPQAGVAGYNSIAVAGGSYGGENSVALGYSRLSDNGKVIFKVSGSSDSSGRFGVGAGVGFQWK